MSGGTDVCTAFVGACRRCRSTRASCRAARSARRSRRSTRTGRPLIDRVGELVLTEPLPSMPVCFWGDEDGSRYRESYFDLYPGVWRHGDWIEITSRGTAIISGRSDSTINRGGVRIGTSEIYRTVTGAPGGARRARRRFPPRARDRPLRRARRRRRPSTASSRRIEAACASECSPRHLPDQVRQVAAVPRTLSGKLLEVPVKRILLGADPADRREPRVAGEPGGARLLRQGWPGL